MSVIYDPRCPPRIFDGQLDVYTTCCDCGTIMKVITPLDRAHPCCTYTPTRLESLATGWLSTILAEDIDAERATAQALREELRRQTVDLAGAATTFAQRGWPVFPIRPANTRCDGTCKGKAYCGCPKKPAIKGGKGFKDATTDPQRITAWWARHPDHNIGLATGHAFDVIDVDTKDSDGNPSQAGPLSFIKCLQHNEIPECHGVAITASGGMHLYVRPTGKGNFQGLRPGIDYRGLGGYVVAPPSLLPGRGRAYTWLTVPSPKIKGGW